MRSNWICVHGFSWVKRKAAGGRKRYDKIYHNTNATAGYINAEEETLLKEQEENIKDRTPEYHRQEDLTNEQSSLTRAILGAIPRFHQKRLHYFHSLLRPHRLSINEKLLKLAEILPAIYLAEQK